jgi:hypothetical protein
MRYSPMVLSASEFASDWLSQFSEAEQPVAAKLADAVMLVSHDTLHRGLRGLLDGLLADRNPTLRDQPIALYAERAVKTQEIKDPDLAWTTKQALPYFPGTATGRATGAGVPAIDPDEPQVGSEGLIAAFITGYGRLNTTLALNHPGPAKLRSKRASHIVIVTDFIGSGDRVWTMIDAFWRVATVRSWHSWGRIRFSVVAYSGTELGIRHVRTHRSKPDVRVVQACPTLTTAFAGAEYRAIHDLCSAHPTGHPSPLGYGWGGALIAFAHGMPNNAPPVLHSPRGGWRPLFFNRSVLAADQHFPGADADRLAGLARDRLQVRAAERFLAGSANRRWIETMLVLTALQEGARTTANTSARTRLPIADVDRILGFTQVARWTDARNALTVLGVRELRRLQRRRARVVVLPTPGQPDYYPTQLRAR